MLNKLYIHIPFCKRACHYCDFHFSTSLRNKTCLIDALCKEIELKKEYLPQKELSSIYFGGGTPSVLDKEEIEILFKTIGKHYIIKPGAEITLEANPDDLDAGKIAMFKASGINRLSIGIQSFFDEHLKAINRSHNSIQAVESVKQAKKGGFENISIDLIYGLPGLSTTKWKQNMEHLFSLDVPHFSAYCLTVEKKTALHHFISSGTISLPGESLLLEQFQLLMEEADKRGFIHYEISNFCKTGMFSKHNSSYWNNEPYIGIGPSAHSYNGSSRQWNIANNALYIKKINSGETAYEAETLTETDLFNEYIMTRLRTIWGINLDFVNTRFGSHALAELSSGSLPYINSGHLKQDNKNVSLTQKGKFLADKIASDLFM